MNEEITIQGKSAILALQQHHQGAKVLFPEQALSVHFVAKYKKSPVCRQTSLRKFIRLPNSDRNPSNSSVCLILPDLDRSDEAARDPDVDRQAREWADKLKNEYGVTSSDYAKIFTFTQLRREHSQQADKHKLSNLYDIFVVDMKLMAKAFNFLGTHFRKTTKLPFPISLSNPRSFSRKLREVYNLVTLSLDSQKDSISIRIGNLHQDLTELSSNLEAVVNKFIENCPGGPVNIRSCYIQMANTEFSLPIFVDFESANDVKLEPLKRKQYSEEFGELSTLPDGLAVKVRSDGLVTVVNEEENEVLYPTKQDEWEANDDLKPLSEKAVKRIIRKRIKLAKAE